jgi:nucleoside transporter
VLFKDKQMAIFFIFSMLLGAALQVTNAYATPFISHFQVTSPDSWGANNANAIYSVSQVAETLGILLIPFAMKKFGIKNVMLIAMGAWVLRFGLFGTGDTGSGVWMIILSCIVYGVAFDFFNISGALYTNSRTKGKLQNSAQGLFMLMTNGIGATVGTLTAQAIVNKFTHEISVDGNIYRVGDWPTAWFIFAGYALVVGILFFILFKKPKGDEPQLG